MKRSYEISIFFCLILFSTRGEAMKKIYIPECHLPTTIVSVEAHYFVVNVLGELRAFNSQIVELTAKVKNAKS
jgi:hypothetical protein